MSGLAAAVFLLVLTLSGTASGLGTVVWRSYSYNHHHGTWQEAQHTCRGSHVDLALIETQADVDNMYLGKYNAWIGLHRGNVAGGWVWSDGANNYNNMAYEWAANEPGLEDACALVTYPNSKIYGSDCESSLFLICEDDSSRVKFVPESKTWSEAQQYCRTVYDDLTNLWWRSVRAQDFPVWTGLYRDGETWKWSSGSSEYRQWAPEQPRDTGDCVTISSFSKKMATQNCEARFPFVCYMDNLLLVEEDKTWEEALEHCRSLQSGTQYSFRYDLVSVQPGDDHSYMRSRLDDAGSDRVWAGLRFLAGDWLWVNGADMSFSHLPLCPPVELRCGTLSANETRGLEIRDCTEKRHFLCYRKW